MSSVYQPKRKERKPYSFFNNFVEHLRAEISLYPDVYEKGGLNASIYYLKMKRPDLFYKKFKSNKPKSYYKK